MKKILLFLIISFFIIPDVNSMSWPAKQRPKGVVVIKSGNKPCPKNYQLVFEDNFDSTALNTNRWYSYYPYDFPYDRLHGKNEGQVFKDENVVLDGNYVNLQARADYPTYCNSDSSECYDKRFSSGVIHSKRLYRYGIFQIRCKIPKGGGYWPAFWMFGGPCWNEIDGFEIEGERTWELHTNSHKGSCGQTPKSISQEHKFDYSLADDFHTYEFIWHPEFIEWKLDGNTIRYFSAYSDANNRPVPPCDYDIPFAAYVYQDVIPHVRMNVIAGLGVCDTPCDTNFFNRKLGRKDAKSGCPYSCAPADLSAFPGNFLIDWIRVYQSPEISTINEDLCASRTIDGPDVICPGEILRYDFSGYGAITGWRLSNNLVMVEEQSTYIRVRLDSLNFSPTATIEPTFATPYDCKEPLTKIVMARNPLQPVVHHEHGPTSNSPLVIKIDNFVPSNTYTVSVSKNGEPAVTQTGSTNTFVFYVSVTKPTPVTYTVSVKNKCGNGIPTAKTFTMHPPRKHPREGIVVSPNPFTDIVNIEYADNLLQYPKVTIRIRNVIGVTLKEYQNAPDQLTSLDLRDLQVGTYSMIFDFESEVHHKTLVK